MDPNETLTELLRLAARITAQEEAGEAPTVEDAYRTADLALALHQWMSFGGFPPIPWAGGYSVGDRAPASVTDSLTPLRAYALVREGGRVVLLSLRGMVDTKQREEARADMMAQMRAEAVWFEDERGTELDKSDRLPERSPQRETAIRCQCVLLGRHHCPLHRPKQHPRR